jgi:hypothetical protein
MVSTEDVSLPNIQKRIVSDHNHEAWWQILDEAMEK